MKNLKKLLCGSPLPDHGPGPGRLRRQHRHHRASTDGDTDAKADGNVPVIGISQYGQHASLDNCREGFLQGLQEAGLVEGTDYTIDYQNASFDDNMAIQIAQSFSAENAALMVGIATPLRHCLLCRRRGQGTSP
ncbi:MAG: ABC transporter substrate binding protein [Evtepia sp.]